MTIGTENPKSLAGFIAWLKEQPADREYKYTAPRECAVAQWLTDIGEKHTCLESAEVDALLGCGRIVNNYPETMGAALKRAQHFAATGERFFDGLDY